jgi:hypothetical protein
MRYQMAFWESRKDWYRPEFVAHLDRKFVAASPAGSGGTSGP